jgi:hypothetical protein
MAAVLDPVDVLRSSTPRLCVKLSLGLLALSIYIQKRKFRWGLCSPPVPFKKKRAPHKKKWNLTREIVEDIFFLK